MYNYHRLWIIIHWTAIIIHRASKKLDWVLPQINMLTVGQPLVYKLEHMNIDKVTIKRKNSMSIYGKKANFGGIVLRENNQLNY